MEQHTPESWNLCSCGKCLTIGGGGHPIANVEHGEWGDSYPAIRLVGEHSLDMKAEAYIEHIPYGDIPKEEAKANAERIVACVNACAGMADPETELTILRQDKADLLGIFQDILNDTEAFADDCDYDLYREKMIANLEGAQAAIAKATQ